MEKEAPQQFCEQVSKNKIATGKSCTNYIPPIYVIQDGMRVTLSMLDHKILTYPCYEVILKGSFDHLVQQIRRDHLIDVAMWEV